MKKHFKRQIKALLKVYESFDTKKSKTLISECLETIRNGNAIIAGGLGKNVPICEKFIGTLTSLGVNAHFLHINSAVHGDLGIIKNGDLVIFLSKSGETEESIHLSQFMSNLTTHNWLLTCHNNSTLSKLVDKTIVLDIKEEGDQWNIVPNNSSVTFLVFLQALAMTILEELPVKLETFKRNHPGGHIGKILKNSNK